jgi:hypothetical protein
LFVCYPPNWNFHRRDPLCPLDVVYCRSLCAHSYGRNPLNYPVQGRGRQGPLNVSGDRPRSELPLGAAPPTIFESSLFCSARPHQNACNINYKWGVARPTEFETVASAFSGKRTLGRYGYWHGVRLEILGLRPSCRVVARERGRALRLPLKARHSSRLFSSDFLRRLCRRAFSLSRQKHDPREHPKLRPNGHNLASPRVPSGRADRQL